MNNNVLSVSNFALVFVVVWAMLSSFFPDQIGPTGSLVAGVTLASLTALWIVCIILRSVVLAWRRWKVRPQIKNE